MSKDIFASGVTKFITNLWNFTNIDYLLSDLLIQIEEIKINSNQSNLK